ncbi:hypothetical protein [Phaeovulum sp. W22_SRMD_FR3]|uniref:hypothetical protein n=1 Tax=Phaeovulum sp. W22_SRMD_FR3 TaxID=3240274 RepID=UPI003F9932F4
MIPARAGPQLIDTGDLPLYPIDASARLTAHYFTMWRHDQFLASDLHLLASYEVQGVARALFDYAQKQTPIGTLPDDDLRLSKLLRIDLASWKDLRARSIGPLHQWQRCRCGDEIRLMHPVVLEVAMAAIEKRDLREASNADKAVYQRQRRLREALTELGCSRDVIADEVLITRMDDWLLETCRSNRRTRAVYERALAHAGAQGWFGSGRKRFESFNN